MHFIHMTTPTYRFNVDSYGNGWAYTVTDRQTGESFFMQDDDATQLQADTEDFTNEDALADLIGVLGEVQ